MRTIRIFFLIFAVIALNSASQLSLKMAARVSQADAVMTVLNLWFFLAAACLGASFLCWQTLLKRKPLAFLHPFCALTYFFVPLLSVALFQEHASALYFVGIFCILAGASLTATGVQSGVTR